MATILRSSTTIMIEGMLNHVNGRADELSEAGEISGGHIY
jgi:hypothetical protein